MFEPAFGLVLRPEIAALSMSGSSIIVAINALLLKRLRLPTFRTRPTDADDGPCPESPDTGVVFRPLTALPAAGPTPADPDRRLE